MHKHFAVSLSILYSPFKNSSKRNTDYDMDNELVGTKVLITLDS